MTTDLVQGYRLSTQQRALCVASGGPDLVPRTVCLLEIAGALDAAALRAALGEVVGRQEILRAVFLDHPGLRFPLQEFREAPDFSWWERDLTAASAANAATAVADLFDSEAARPPGPPEEPPLRAGLLRLPAGRHALLLSLPGLCADARTASLLGSAIARAYGGAADADAESAIQYADYAAWQEELDAGGAGQAGPGEAAQRYWEENTRIAPRPLCRPALRGARRGGTAEPDDAAPPAGGGLLGTVRFDLAGAGAAGEAALLAVWATLLQRFDGGGGGDGGALRLAYVASGRDEQLGAAFGAYARRLPLCLELDLDGSFSALAAAIAVRLDALAGLVEHLPLEEPNAAAAAYEFEYLELPAAIASAGARFAVERVQAGPAGAALKLLAVRSGGALRAELRHDRGRVDGEAAALFARCLQTLAASAACTPAAPGAGMRLLGDEDRRAALAAAAGPQRPGADRRPLHRRIEEQALRTPDRVAVAGDAGALTYGELDAWAAAIARRLAAEHALGPDAVAGLLASRSPAWVAGMLGILKTGGAYAPLDEQAPPDRLGEQLAAAGARCVVAERALAERLPATGLPLVWVDDLAPAVRPQRRAPRLPRPQAAPPHQGGEAAPENLCYVLFTSGSTGAPKAVGVPHAALASYCEAVRELLALPEGLCFAVVSTLAADLCNTMVFPSLLTGGTLHLVPRADAADAERYAAYLERHAVDAVKIVPSHMAALLQSRRSLPRRFLVMGGEVLPPALARQIAALAPRCEVFNHYGPTETTVGVVAGRLPPPPGGDVVPLGRPLANAIALVLDHNLEPLPAGVTGELHAGGAGVARGYVGRGDLTAERFVPHPCGAAGERLYRTGDLARHGAGGQLEFLGRRDDQVKIRGYRVEPGEIEAALLRHPQVRAAAAAARQGRLVAWVAADGALTADALREHLERTLPEPMLPAALVFLPELPRTANGKLDRRALPEPTAAAAAAAAHIAPRTPTETILAQIWAGVLRLPEVGVEDSFFALGGDSILSIQIIARAHQAGLRLTPMQIFLHPTIAGLAAVADGAAAEPAAAPQAAAGPLPLTPIQRWFFDLQAVNPNHWNQAILLRLARPLPAVLLRRALDQLLAHHDALRLRFHLGAAGWEQTCADAGESAQTPPIAQHDLAAQDAAAQDRALAALGRETQAGLDIGSGPLLRAALFDLGARGRRLLLVIHHLVVDAVSWRILIEDLETASAQLQRGEPVALPARTASYRRWAELWAERNRQQGGEPGSAPPGDAPRQIAPLPLDHPAGANTVGSNDLVEVELTAAETGALLQEMRDAMLAALVLALAPWSGDRPLWVDVEGHGRGAFPDLDTSRTVGWFTARVPVELPATLADADAAATLAAVRETVRRALQAAGQRPAVRPQVSFNYLGQIDGQAGASAGDGALFALADEPTGPPQDERGLRTHLLQITARVSAGRLRATWTFSRNLHRRQTIAGHAARFAAELRRLAGVGSAARGLADSYPLTPLQQGILFHALHAGETGVYVEQVTCRVTGALDAAAFERAWRLVVERHPALRTACDWHGGHEPLQVVHRQVDLRVERHDWRGVPASERERRIDLFLAADRARGFDLAAAPLMRLSLLQLADDLHQAVWTNHHIILDGWSRPVVLDEMFAAYEALARGLSPSLGAVRPYRDYVAWLAGQDLGEAERFWRRRLAGFAARNRLRIDRGAGAGRATAGASDRKERRRLTAAATASLARFARERQLTVYSVLQGVWALVLAGAAGARDLVYGTVVAGRPAALPEVERMVGLFINTLPARVAVDGGEPLVPWLRRLQAEQVEMRQFEHTPLAAIQPWSELPAGEPLFDTLFVFENFPSLSRAGAELDERLQVRFTDLRGFDQNNFPLTLTVVPSDPYGCEAMYDPERFAAADVAALLDGFVRVLDEALAHPEASLAEIARTALASPCAGQGAKPMTFKLVTPKPVSLDAADLIDTAPLVPGASLPLVVRPLGPGVDLAGWAAANRDLVRAQLARHGAVLFRGFPVDPEADFEPVAETLTSPLYDENGEHHRESVSGKVYTPVAFSPAKVLLWHNENSFNHQWPGQIWFGCAVPAAAGGEMPLADSREVYRRLPARLRDRFTERGVMYIRTYRPELGLSWQKVLGTERREEAEAYCRQGRMGCEWRPGDSLRTVAVRPAVLRHPVTGESCWFNQAQHWHPSCLDPETRQSMAALFPPEDFPRNCCYGDGSPIADDDMGEILAVYRSIEVVVPWQRGDMLLVDNMLTAHGRNAYQGPRRMLVAMGDMRSF